MSRQRLDVGAFQIRLRKVRLPFGLVLDTVDVDGADLTLATEPFEASAPKPGSLVARVLPADVAAYLETLQPAGLRDFAVSPDVGRLRITAVRRVIVDLKAEVLCALRVEAGKQLHVDLISAEVAGTGATNLIQGQLERINPILDAADFPVPVTLRSATVEDGAVVVRGDLVPPGRVELPNRGG